MRGFRAKDADRDRFIELIEAAYVDGQLNSADRDLRVGRALSAETIDELQTLTRDLQLPPGAVTTTAPGARAAGPRIPFLPKLVGGFVALGFIGVALFVGAIVVTMFLALGDGSPSSEGGSGPVFESEVADPQDVVEEPPAPFERIDHVTHCVHPGGMSEWVDFYERIFGFEQVFKFVAGNAENGFDTIAVRAPDSAACVTVVEPMGAASQIQEFIDEYHGEGIQHIAMSSGDLYETVERLVGQGIEFLPTPDTYYDALDERVPGHGEDVARLKRLDMLLDGANTGENPSAKARLLLQIFTRKMVGPIFFEAIQRKGDTSFGEGNAKALFEAIKREQESAAT